MRNSRAIDPRNRLHDGKSNVRRADLSHMLNCVSRGTSVGWLVLLISKDSLKTKTASFEAVLKSFLVALPGIEPGF